MASPNKEKQQGVVVSLPNSSSSSSLENVLAVDAGTAIWEYLRFADHQRLFCTCRTVHGQKERVQQVTKWLREIDLLIALQVEPELLRQMSGFIQNGTYYMEYSVWNGEYGQNHFQASTIFGAFHNILSGYYGCSYEGTGLSFEHGWFGMEDDCCKDDYVDLEEEDDSSANTEEEEEEEDSSAKELPKEEDEERKDNGNRSTADEDKVEEQPEKTTDEDDDTSSVGEEQEKPPKRMRRCESRFCEAAAGEICFLYSFCGNDDAQTRTYYCGACVDRHMFLALRFCSSLRGGIRLYPWEFGTWEEQDYTPRKSSEEEDEETSESSGEEDEDTSETCWAVTLFQCSRPYCTGDLRFLAKEPPSSLED
jgi:hypothetical protein